LPIPASTDSKDIQRAAAEAAEAFRPSESEAVSGESAGTTPHETPESNNFFMDEEALFCMPGLLANMAEGLMIPPPHYVEVGDYGEAAAHLSMELYYLNTSAYYGSFDILLRQFLGNRRNILAADRIVALFQTAVTVYSGGFKLPFKRQRIVYESNLIDHGL
uniref:Dehydration-responsive element-binding protein 1B-like n=1 Tax=Nicotiana sylvestris TaxID=4096 RepID=A0A1U7XT82_NICSY